MAVAAIVRGAAGAVAFDEEDFAFIAIAGGAIHQLAGQAAAGEDVLAVLHRLLGLGGGLARLGGEDHLVHDLLGFLGILLQELRQVLVDDARNDAVHFGIVEANLRLRLELRLRHRDADDGGDAFAEILAVRRDVS